MDERALKEALDSYAARRIPLSHDLWPTIRERAMRQRRHRDTAAIPAGEQTRAAHRSPYLPPAWRRLRRPLIIGANVITTVALLLVVTLVLALVVSGMTVRRTGGALGPTVGASPTPATPPPGQPFPVPNNCLVTPLRGPEERGGFTAYWIEHNGIALGIADGVLYQGATAARATADLSGAVGRVGENPPVSLGLYGRRDTLGLGAIEFPEPGCWTIEAHGRPDWRSGWKSFVVTVYVYPASCPHPILNGRGYASVLPCRPPDLTR